MDIKKEKFIGEAPLKGDPTKKLILTIKDGSVTTPKIADRAVTPEKLSNRVKAEVVKPLVDAAKDDLQNQIDSLEVSGIALSQEFGNNPNIGISQKVLTERFLEVIGELGGSNEVLVCKHWTDTVEDYTDLVEGDLIMDIGSLEVDIYRSGNLEKYADVAKNTIYVNQDTDEGFYYDGSYFVSLISKDEILSIIDTTRTNAVNSAAVASYVANKISELVPKDTAITGTGSTTNVPTSNAVVEYIDKVISGDKEVIVCTSWDSPLPRTIQNEGSYAKVKTVTVSGDVYKIYKGTASGWA